jgi:ribosomal protein S5
LVAVSIVEFKRAKLLQDAKLSGITVKDIARALATMAGVKAVSDFDAGFTSSYINKAEAMLELATEFAQERRGNN